jgi:hypothetical protein
MCGGRIRRLIPFQVVVGGRIGPRRSLEDQTGRGTGIREAQERYEFLIQLGGNEATRRTIPTVCAKSSVPRGMMFYPSLRLGFFARCPTPLAMDPAGCSGGREPYAMAMAPPACVSELGEPGVCRVFDSLLEPEQRGDMYSRYDFDCIPWQIGDCPTLAAETCNLARGSIPRVAVLIARSLVHGLMFARSSPKGS